MKSPVFRRFLLRGQSGLPADWVETVCRVNQVEIDIRGLAEGLLRLEG